MASILDTRFFATLLGVWRYKECEKFYAGIRIEIARKKYGEWPPCFVVGLGSAYQRPVFTAHRSLLAGYRGVILGPYVPVRDIAADRL
jgi:hypothetical protein